MSLQKPQRPIERIAPDDFVDTWDRKLDKDIETLEEALRAAERAESTTQRSEMTRCPECASVRVLRKQTYREFARLVETDYKCGDSRCGAHFDTPLPPTGDFAADEPVCPNCESFRLDRGCGEIKCRDCDWSGEQAADAAARELAATDTAADPFEWLDDDDLVEPPTETIRRLLADADRETCIELAIELYRPWQSENEFSYPDIAQVLPYSSTWIGDRVREWRNGEHRRKVPGPFPKIGQ